MNHDMIESLIRKGRKLFPIRSMRKKPADDGWKEFATEGTDDERIGRILTYHVQNEGVMNFGMAVGEHSGVLTIDVDFKHPEAEKFWIKWEHILRQGCVVSSGNGKHCHFKHPGTRVLSSIGGICRGIDLLCDTRNVGGARYVLIPDSIHPSGARYEYDDPFSGVTLADDLPDLPPEIDDLINDQSQWEGKISESAAMDNTIDPATWYAENPQVLFNVDPFDDEPILEGNRNNDMARIAGKLLYMNSDNHNYLLEDLNVDVAEINVKRCDPALDQTELELMCESIYKMKKKSDAKKASEEQKAEEGAKDFILSPASVDSVKGMKPLGAAFSNGVINPPANGEKPEPKLDPNNAALYVMHQAPFKPEQDGEEHNLIYLESDFYQRHDNVWRKVSDQSVSSVIQSYYILAKKSEIANMLSFIKNYLYFPIKCIPFWKTPEAPAGYPDDPRKLIPFSNGLFDVEHYIRTGKFDDCLKPFTVALFNTVKMPYSFNPAAKCPEWSGFLTSLWDSDKSDRALAMQEWAGHMMLPDITQQKIAVLHGTTRSGKSTIGKVLHKLIGHDNSTATTLHTLTSEHGPSSLIGKTLAILYDAHLPAKANAEKAIETLKSISGGDPQIVNRKFHDPFTTILSVRIMMVCNEIPKLNDSGNALLARLIPFRFKKSFLGVERHDLEFVLTKELEGIAVWALEGIKRYINRGHLMTPREATEDLQEIKRILNPVAGFMDDCIIYPTADPSDEVSMPELQKQYLVWADQSNIAYTLQKDRFFSVLKNLCPGVRRVMRNRIAYWKGIRLRDQIHVDAEMF